MRLTGYTAGLAAVVVAATLAGAAPSDGPACITNRPILFVTRSQYTPDHHNTATFFPAARGEYNNGRFTPGGALKILDAAAGTVRTLLDCPDGVIRDPEVHFDGDHIIFSMRRTAQDSYHLYDIRADGTGLRQLTALADADDFDPVYLPDDRVAFSSTREPKYVACNRHIGANLYRMDADGANIHQIGKSTLFESQPSLLPDGRLLYTRWEYVDRNFGDAQGLWTCYPDGTAHAVYWGNNTGSPGAVLDGQPIPGTERIIGTFSSCHDRPWGALAILDRALGVDGPDAVVRIWPESARGLVRVKGHFDDFKRVQPRYEDPFPLADPADGRGGRYFLCARTTGPGEKTGLFLLDAETGAETALYEDPDEHTGCFDPMPLAPRPRPPQVPGRREFGGTEGAFLVADVYQGTHMAGVQRGEVRFLRVIEVLEKRQWTHTSWGGQGTEAPAVNWHDFNAKRILGTVPVDGDGSAFFTCPTDAFVYFQLLDAHGAMIQSMRSGTIVQPGEVQSCTGCHESRLSAPPPGVVPAASRRPPDRLTGWYGPPRPFSYMEDVQPVFDAHCVQCHDFGKPAGEKLVLAGDRDLFFNASYTELCRKGYTAMIGAGPAEIQPARGWGSARSRLVGLLRGGHPKDATVPREALDRIVTWVDLNAPYYSTYASAYPANLAGRCPLDSKAIKRLGELTGRNFGKMAGHGSNPGPQVSFERPDLSPCLTGLDGAARDEALAIIRAGTRALAAVPRADMPGFAPCDTDSWREEKYGERRALETAYRAAVGVGERRYDPRRD